MKRVHVICEGQTEEMFIKDVLALAYPNEITFHAALVGTPGHKGGAISINRLFRDIELRLKTDRSAYCTTLIDYYGLPSNFPGRTDALQEQEVQDKARVMKNSLMTHAREKLQEGELRRFIPYVQMHEFEALLFSDPSATCRSWGQPQLINKMEAIARAFDSPEEINNSPETAPSRRITSLLGNSYNKPYHGAVAALEIGLPVMRDRCSIFSQWLSDLEELPRL